MCGCHSHVPMLGTWPATQACALTGNQTSDSLVCRPALSPLNHISQGGFLFLWLDLLGHHLGCWRGMDACLLTGGKVLLGD